MFDFKISISLVIFKTLVSFVTDENDDSARNRHRQKRGLLKMYYGVGEETGKPTSLDPCDINGAHFQPETYLDKTFKEKTLTELMDKEGDISKRKDSSMIRGGSKILFRERCSVTGAFIWKNAKPK